MKPNSHVLQLSDGPRFIVEPEDGKFRITDTDHPARRRAVNILFRDKRDAQKIADIFNDPETVKCNAH